MMIKYFSFLLMLLAFIEVQGQVDYMTSFDENQIAFTDEGSGFPVLLVHGFINDGGMWERSLLKQQLLNQGYRVIVPDLRGNGKSDKPETEAAYQNDAEVQDLILLIKHLKIQELHAVGYSRGSIVLAKLLSQDNRIKKAVLGGMGVDFTDSQWDRRIMFMNAFNGKITEETKGAVDYASSIDANLWILHLLQKYQPVTSLSQLKKITAQVLVIAGDEDLDNGNPEELKNEIPKSALKIVPGNHNETYKTAPFSEAILQFLE